MPVVQSMAIPQPKNWQDFETIVRDAQAQRWKSTNLQKNGRSGQTQHGVDIWGPDDIGRPVGIQCKRFSGILTLKIVEDEIAKAEKFKGVLTALYIATTAEHDAKLQQQVRLLSDKRVAQSKFAVSILYWDEIIAGLILNPEVFKSHYPQYNLGTSKQIDKERLIALLELGYYGSDLWAYIILLYGEFGMMAQVDTDQVIVSLNILEKRAQQLLSPKDASPLIHAISKVRDGCIAPKSDSSDWDEVEIQAKRVSSRIRAIVSSIPITESNMLDLALQLGRIYHHSDELPSSDTRSIVRLKVQSVLPNESTNAVKKRFADAAKLTSGYSWAQRIYNFLDHEVRFRM